MLIRSTATPAQLEPEIGKQKEELKLDDMRKGSTIGTALEAGDSGSGVVTPNVLEGSQTEDDVRRTTSSAVSIGPRESVTGPTLEEELLSQQSRQLGVVLEQEATTGAPEVQEMGRGMGTNPVFSGRGKETAPYQRLWRSGQGFIRNVETDRSKAERSEVVRSQAGRPQGSGGGMNPRQPSEVEALQIELSKSTLPKRTGCSPCSSSVVKALQTGVWVRHALYQFPNPLRRYLHKECLPFRDCPLLTMCRKSLLPTGGQKSLHLSGNTFQYRSCILNLLQKKETGICGNLLISLEGMEYVGWQCRFFPQDPNDPT